MVYDVLHSTTYRYADPVSISQNIAHLRPRHCDRQQWQRSELQIDPTPTVISHRTDFFGNPLTFFALQERHTTLSVQASGRVTVQPAQLPELATSTPWELVRQELAEARRGGNGAAWSAMQFTFASPYVQLGPALSDYAMESFPPGRPILKAASDLASRIYRDFKFDTRATNISTPLPDVLAMRRGVCQDFAHLMVGCLRSVGLAGRYVSGYLLTRPLARSGGRTSPGMIGGDVSHAWASVYCGRDGWIDVDPTNDQFVSDRHVTLCWARDFGDVSPMQGVILGGRRHTLSISVDVCPVLQDEDSSPANT